MFINVNTMDSAICNGTTLNAHNQMAKVDGAPRSVSRARKRRASVQQSDTNNRTKMVKMSPLNLLLNDYKQLEAEWAKKSPDLVKCGQFLTKLKIGLTNLDFLPTSNSIVAYDELVVSRNILEIGAQWSVLTGDIAAFERYMAQLKCYYFDYEKQLPESPFKLQLLGLNLLCLLSQNRVAEFHTELELLPVDLLTNDVYIKHPVALEQYLMEGCYNKIFLAKGNVPAQSYNFFMDILLDTVRNEIAECLERAYEKISLKEATRKLYFSNVKDTQEFARKKGWQLTDNFYRFAQEVRKVDEPIPSGELVVQTLEYAKELEMIV